MKKIIALTTVLALILIACNQNTEIHPIKKDIKELVFASGELIWDNAYQLTAQTDGILTNANFEIGNIVAPHNILATIDNKINVINVQNSKIQMDIANTNLSEKSPFLQQLKQNIAFAENKLKQDKLQLERYERLYKTESISKLDYETAALNMQNSLSQYNGLKKQYDQILQQAKQQYSASKALLNSSKTTQEYNQVKVSEKGTIINKLKYNGDYVKKGDVIAIIANADAQNVKVVLNIDENSIAKVKIGQVVYIKLNTNKNEVLTGKISEIQAAFDVASQSFICKAVFDHPLKKSLYGTQLEANILVGEKKNALLIPRNYVGFGNTVNVKGKDKSVVIKAGIFSTEYVEVLGGLEKDAILLPPKP